MPPAMLRFRVSESLPADLFSKVGAEWARLIHGRLQKAGVDLANPRRVLDFGCGCGRTLVWLLRDCPGVEFHGADVDAAAIEWCAKNLPSGCFRATPSQPPLPYPAEHFDIVYCLSVFTHLNESMQDLWLAELSRVLKPSGVLIFTVHGKSATAKLDPAGLETLRTAGFVHRRSQKLKGLVPEWYQTTWHSREYILNRVSAWFCGAEYEALPNSIQDLVVARKPTAARQPNRSDF